MIFPCGLESGFLCPAVTSQGGPCRCWCGYRILIRTGLVYQQDDAVLKLLTRTVFFFFLLCIVFCLPVSRSLAQEREPRSEDDSDGPPGDERGRALGHGRARGPASDGSGRVRIPRRVGQDSSGEPEASAHARGAPEEAADIRFALNACGLYSLTKQMLIIGYRIQNTMNLL